MEFRIKSVFLIPKNKEKQVRSIDFELNKVNIITGGSEKGKSTIIAIIDYCLGSRKCKIPTRKIRDYTEWFGIIVSLGVDRELLLCRKEPGELGASGEMFMKEGIKLTIPDSIEKAYNVNDIKTRLNSIANLSYIDFSEGDSKGFDSRPSFRDMVSFVFQPQYIIANQSTLFYRADAMANREKLRSIFPYIIGAVDNNYLVLKEELKVIERNLYSLEKELDKKTKFVNNWIGQLRGTFGQAMEFGLVADTSYPDDSYTADQLIDILKQITLNQENKVPTISLDAVTNSSNKLSQLIEREVAIAHNLNSLKHRQQILLNLVNTNRAYRNDLVHQFNRLKGVSWFNDMLKQHDEVCPFCNTSNQRAKKHINELITANKEIKERGIRLNDNHSVLSSEALKIASEIEENIERLNEVREEIKALRLESNTENKALNTLNTVYKFIGKLESELKIYDDFSDTSQLRDKIKQLKSRKDTIYKSISKDVIDNKIRRAKDKISEFIKVYAKIFNAENNDESISFNENDLTLNFISETGRIDALYEVGSGSNYMAYHVATSLAFQEFFIAQKHHPVPNFLVLDQPSQVYFPETDIDMLDKSEDVQRVRRIFKALETAIKRTKGNLQIIILEHAGSYAWQGFNNMKLIRRWRDDEEDNALIPEAWFI